jgi:putative transposase
MPRANRHFLPGYIWHITHRCHQQEFLLRFSRDRNCWIYWLYQATKRYGLCVLNYMVTSNHVHLLVKDSGYEVIPRSMQLVAGRTAQAYNQRKSRKGAFWEDRYHATAVESGDHLARCLVYIDLNMVRAGTTQHPEEWRHCGYHEIQQQSFRYPIIDHAALLDSLGFESIEFLQTTHRHWVDGEIGRENSRRRDPRWSESIAIGRQHYVDEFKRKLGHRASGRKRISLDRGFQLKEVQTPYG